MTPASALRNRQPFLFPSASARTPRLLRTILTYLVPPHTAPAFKPPSPPLRGTPSTNFSFSPPQTSQPSNDSPHPKCRQSCTPTTLQPYPNTPFPTTSSPSPPPSFPQPPPTATPTHHAAPLSQVPLLAFPVSPISPPTSPLSFPAFRPLHPSHFPSHLSPKPPKPFFHLLPSTPLIREPSS